MGIEVLQGGLRVSLVQVADRSLESGAGRRDGTRLRDPLAVIKVSTARFAKSDQDPSNRFN